MIFPREMENSILNNPPPELKIQPQDFVYNTRMQLEYLDDDQKGYVIGQETSSKNSMIFRSGLGMNPKKNNSPEFLKKINALKLR